VVYYSIFQIKTIEGLATVRSQAFLLRGKNKIINNSINPIKKRKGEKRLTQSELAFLGEISQPTISQFEIGGVVPSEVQIRKITEILGIGPGTLNKELHQFYEDKKKELKKRIEGEQGNAKIPV